MRLFDRDLGGAGNPPLIVLHGLLGSSRNWQSAGADLSRRYHVWALDLRNHGRSPHDPDASYQAMAGDVLAWMDSRGLGKTALMGHSMGGKVAMLIACRWPERVERLVAVDVAPKDYLLGGHRGEFMALNELDLRTLQSRAEAEMKLETRVPSLGMRKFLTTNLERDGETGAWRWIVNLPVLTNALPDLEKTPLVETDRYDGPTLFVAGGRSRYIEKEDETAITRHFPSSKIVVIPNSGHNPHMDARMEFVKAVLG